ncbi:MAG: efflux RND transporter periplasmic adaptor subunit [Rhodospirillaceae bacterium]|nr:efflux RND transporter periplasmic adaptor subunit [Rhodospirillaceae bacterium]
MPVAPIALLALAAIGGAAAYWYYGGGRAKPAEASAAITALPVTVAKPVVKEIVEWDEFTGRFDAVESVEIRARVNGYLAAVKFTDGSLVKKGDLLFVIDQRPFKIALRDAEAALAAAEAKLEFADSEFKRVETTARTGASPERLLEQRRQELETARADRDRARTALDRAKLDLEFTEIRAPVAGRIGRKLVSEGNLVAANTSLLTSIVSLDPIYFYFDVDEQSFLGYLRMGRSGERPSLRTAGNDADVILPDEKTFARRGKIDFIDNRLDSGTGTMRGRAVFENKELFLTPGMFGRIRIPGSGKYQAVLVPDEAIGTDQNRRVVYVVGKDGKVVLTPIRLGPHIDGYRVVREGLKGDETIVVNGLMRVRLGAKLAPQMTALPPSR